MDDHALHAFLLGKGRDPEHVKTVLLNGSVYAPVAIVLGAFVFHLFEPLGALVIGVLLLGPPMYTTLDDGGILVSWLILSPLVILGTYVAFLTDPWRTGIFPPFEMIEQMIKGVVGFGTAGYVLGAGLRWKLGASNPRSSI